jgi:hypothetical protein
MALLHEWQDLIGAILGASAAFFVWYFAEKYKQRREFNEKLYYIHRLLIDQINSVIDTQETIERFLDQKLGFLIDHQRIEGENEYSVDTAFFPLFSTRGLNSDIHRESSGSAYIDNKMMWAYKISQDLPLMIEDLRGQFHETLKFNKEICFNKLNSPKLQRGIYLSQLSQYREVLKREVLGHNVPTFLKVLTEALVPLVELREIGLLRWNLRFGGHFKYFKNKDDFSRFRKNGYDRLENFFEAKVKEQLTSFQKES